MHKSNLFFQHHAVPVPMFLRGCLRGCETPARRFAARPPFRPTHYTPLFNICTLLKHNYLLVYLKKKCYLCKRSAFHPGKAGCAAWQAGRGFALAVARDGWPASDVANPRRFPGSRSRRGMGSCEFRNRKPLRDDKEKDFGNQYSPYLFLYWRLGSHGGMQRAMPCNRHHSTIGFR